MKRFIITTISAVVCIQSFVYAQNIRVMASVNQKQVPVNGQLQLQLTVEGSQQVEPPNIDIEGMRADYRGPSTQITMINGVTSSSVTHSYVLRPQIEGVVIIPALEVRVAGKAYTTKPIQIEVLPPSAVTASASGGGLQLDQETLEKAFQFDIVLEDLDRPIYVNESIPIRLQLLLADIPVQIRSMPTLEADGFRVSELKQPSQSRAVVDGQTYRAFDFHGEIIPIRSGDLALGPANIEAQIVIQEPRNSRRSSSFFDDFFGARSQVYPVTVSARSVPITVMPLPSVGRPASFQGAVGQFQLQRQASPLEVSTGEPVTVRWIIRGKGNLDTLKPPVIRQDAGWKTYEAKLLENAQAGYVVYEQVFIPLDISVSQLPYAELSFFNPQLGDYQIEVAEPLAIVVTPSSEGLQPAILSAVDALPQGAKKTEKLGKDIVYIKDTLGKVYPIGWKWYHSVGYWVIFSVGILLFVAQAVFLKYRQRLHADPHLLKASRAFNQSQAHLKQAHKHLQSREIESFYAVIHKTLQHYVGARFRLPIEGFTAAEAEQHLPGKGVPSEQVAQVKALLDQCDAVRFAPQSELAGNMPEVVNQTEMLIRALEKIKT